MEQIAYSMEIHAIAHEYGHHNLSHGRDISEDPQKTEFEADSFAIRISSKIESNLPPQLSNPYLGSGAGASILLRSLDLLRKHSDAIVGTQNSDLGSHPEIFRRIQKFENLGSLEPRRLASYSSCLLYTSPSPRDATLSRMPSSA